MKTRCGKCAAVLDRDGSAYICSYECTFCPACASDSKGICPNCGGELVQRPRRALTAHEPAATGETGAWNGVRWWVLWVVSFGVWTLVALAASGSIYELNRSRGYLMSYGSILALELSQILTYVPLTPFAFALALRFPVQREKWVRRTLLHLGFAIAFSALHSLLRGITPYAFWDPKAAAYASAVWNSKTHTFHVMWPILERLFLSNLVDDITGTYVPIVFIAHAFAYYGRFRDHAIHSAKLEMELARAHLQALKSHLQPHFLFNTMHSISALMHTDVTAADKMMARLSDLLRMTLDSEGIQVTTLNSEMEFVGGYLEIEKIRFEERLTVTVDISPETLDARIPHLLLQPLVENAVRHGVSRLSSGGTIWITARRERSQLEMRVKDNGPGLKGPADVRSKSGFGLRATRERLVTLYGEKQSLDIHNSPGGGVEVCVRIPFRVEPDLPTDARVLVRTIANGEITA